MFKDGPQVTSYRKVFVISCSELFGKWGFEICTSMTGWWMRRSSDNRPQKLCCTIVGGQYLHWVKGLHIAGELQRTWREFKWVCGLRELKRCGNLWKMIVAMLQLALLISLFKLDMEKSSDLSDWNSSQIWLKCWF